jgi:hypothetical protein
VTVAAALAGAAALVAAPPASAAGPWYVGPTGTNNASCGLTAAAPCATVTYVLGTRPSVAGDTVNVAPGTYVDHPVLGSKSITIAGSGPGVIFDGGGTTYALAVNGGAVTNAVINLNDLTLRNGGFSSGTLGGGALPVLTSTVNTSNVTITGSKSAYGGGAMVYAGATLTMTGGALSNNTASAAAVFQGWGGAVYVQGKTSATSTAPPGVLRLTGVAVTGNTANGAAQGLAGLGGGILNAGSTTISGATFTGNRAIGTGSTSAYGGGIYNASAANGATPSLSLTDTTVSGGSVASNAVAGGGLVNAGSLTATNTTISGNAALLAGGLYATGGTASFTSSAIRDNTASNAGVGLGGGAYAIGATLTLDGTAVSGNSAAVAGGGLAVAGTATVAIQGASSVSGNDAVSGGGILNAGTLTVAGSHIDGNSASFQGGGVYNGSSAAADAPRATLTDSTVDGNDAAQGGGGLLTLQRATLSVSGGEVNGNTAVGGAGVVVGDGAPATFAGTDFLDNTATSIGGGAVLNAGTLALDQVRIHNTHATHTTGNTGLGAGIYSGSSAANAVTKLTVTRSEISGNDGYAGSALLTFSNGTGATNAASIDNSTIVDNTNSSTVGALEVFHPLTLTNSTVTGNTAAGTNAGALAMADSTKVGVAGTILSGNGAKSCSAPVNDGGHNLTDPADASCGFTTGKHDVLKAPQLGALADNGGPTLTRLPSPTSPALDVVSPGTSTGLTDAVGGGAVQLCASGSTDQRGTTRPQGARCDLGAVEADQVVPTVTGPAAATYSVGVGGAPVVFGSTGSPQPTLSATGLPGGVTFHDNGDGTAANAGAGAAGEGGGDGADPVGLAADAQGQRDQIGEVHGVAHGGGAQGPVTEQRR